MVPSEICPVFELVQVHIRRNLCGKYRVYLQHLPIFTANNAENIGLIHRSAHMLFDFLSKSIPIPGIKPYIYEKWHDGNRLF